MLPEVTCSARERDGRHRLTLNGLSLASGQVTVRILHFVKDCHLSLNWSPIVQTDRPIEKLRALCYQFTVHKATEVEAEEEGAEFHLTCEITSSLSLCSLVCLHIYPCIPHVVHHSISTSSSRPSLNFTVSD